MKLLGTRGGLCVVTQGVNGSEGFETGAQTRNQRAPDVHQMCKWVNPNEGAYICCSFSGDWLTSAPGFASLSHTFKESLSVAFPYLRGNPNEVASAAWLASVHPILLHSVCWDPAPTPAVLEPLVCQVCLPQLSVCSLLARV